MKNTLLLISAVCISITGFAQEAWTLERCIEQALAGNLSVAQGSLNSRINKLNYLQSRLSLLPTVNGSASHSYNVGRAIDPTTNLFETENIQANSFSLSSGVTLFSGFTRLNSIRQAKYAYEAGVADLEKTRNDIILSVTSAFLQVMFNRELIRIAEDQLRATAGLVDRTGKMVAAGALAEGELLQMKAQLETDRLGVVSSRNQLDLSLIDLMIIMQVDLSKKIDITAPEITLIPEVPDSAAVDGIIKTAEQVQPAVRSGELNRKASLASFSIARGSQSPSLSAFGSLGTNYSSVRQTVTVTGIKSFPLIGYAGITPVYSVYPEYNYAVDKTPLADQLEQNLYQGFGMSLSVPVFNGGSTRIEIQKARIGVMMAENNLLMQKQLVMQDVHKAYADAKAAGLQFSASRQSTASLETALRYVRARYDQGLISYYELTSAENNLARAKSELLQSKYEYIFKLKILDFYQGKPITLN